MTAKTFETDALRIFRAHSSLIRRCIEGFSTFARDDGNGRIALGFIPHAPEKYSRLGGLYQTAHQVLIGLYRVHKDGAQNVPFDDWMLLLSFDVESVRAEQGWDGSRALSEPEQILRQQFDRLAADLNDYRSHHLKDILCYARQEAETSFNDGRMDAIELYQSVSDAYFSRTRRAKAGSDERPESSRRYDETAELVAQNTPLLKRMLGAGIFWN